MGQTQVRAPLDPLLSLYKDIQDIKHTSEVLSYPWSQIPVEVIANIFSFLTISEIKNTTLVSKKWNYLTWRHCTGLSLSRELHNVLSVTNSTLQIILPRCVSLIKLEVPYCRLITDDGMKIIVESCGRNLVELNISGLARITKIGFHLVLKHCINLKVLKASFLYSISADEALMGEKIGCVNLKSIDLHSWNCTKNGIEYLVSKCSNLEHLVLCNCAQINDEAIEIIAQKLPKLKSLNIGRTKISNKGIQALQKNSELQNLNLYCLNDKYCTIQEIGNLCACLPDLRELDLGGFYGSQSLRSPIVDEKFISLITKHCTKLERLSLRNQFPQLTGQHIYDLLNKLSSLVYLDLVNCRFPKSYIQSLSTTCKILC